MLYDYLFLSFFQNKSHSLEMCCHHHDSVSILHVDDAVKILNSTPAPFSFDTLTNTKFHLRWFLYTEVDRWLSQFFCFFLFEFRSSSSFMYCHVFGVERRYTHVCSTFSYIVLVVEFSSVNIISIFFLDDCADETHTVESYVSTCYISLEILFFDSIFKQIVSVLFFFQSCTFTEFLGGNMLVLLLHRVFRVFWR